MKTLFLILTLFVVGAFAQDAVTEDGGIVEHASPETTYNVKCSDLGTYAEVKVDPLRSGWISYTGIGLQTVSVYKDSETQFDWKATAPVEKVIINSEYNTYKVYSYNPASQGANNLRSYYWDGHGFKDITNIRFCYRPIPTSAEVTVSGTITDFYGRPIPRAVVTLIGQNGQLYSAMTNTFGRYSIPQLGVMELYVIQVKERRHEFPRNLTVFLHADTTVDISALHPYSDSKIVK